MTSKSTSIFQVAPSILSADFCNLERDILAIENADWVHIDVMDNHFVPNLTLGLPVVQRIIEVAPVGLKTDVHLMIENPDHYAPEYAKLGANSVTFHYNAAAAPVRLAREIRSLGVKAAIALRPAEPVEPLFDIVEEFDMILVMTVEPGFGGQKFLANQMSKVLRLREFLERIPENERPLIQVDGGVSRSNVDVVAKHGENITVAGSAVYGAENIAAEVEIIRELGAKAYLDTWGSSAALKDVQGSCSEHGLGNGLDSGLDSAKV